MRLLVHTVLFLMVAGLLAGMVFYHRNAQEETASRDEAREEVRRFQQQISLQSALEIGVLNEHGYPSTVQPEWFEGQPPTNPLFGPGHPWVEIAGIDDKLMRHPIDWAISDTSVARFWYNPYQGLVRARVPMGVSEAVARDLYNYINETTLDVFSSE